MTILLWIAAIALIAIGVAGTVLPLLPGPILAFAGIALAAWIDDFARIFVAQAAAFAKFVSERFDPLDQRVGLIGQKLRGFGSHMAGEQGPLHLRDIRLQAGDRLRKALHRLRAGA